MQILQDYNALFQARALIGKECREELLKYLDVPAFEVGDLYYIQNLVAAIQARPCFAKTASPPSGGEGTAITYALHFVSYGSTLVLTDTLPVGMGTPGSFELEGTDVVPTYDSGHHRLTWSDALPEGQKVTIRYEAIISTGETRALANFAELSGQDGVPNTAEVMVLVNPYSNYLPLILKGG